MNIITCNSGIQSLKLFILQLHLYPGRILIWGQIVPKPINVSTCTLHSMHIHTLQRNWCACGELGEAVPWPHVPTGPSLLTYIGLIGTVEKEHSFINIYPSLIIGDTITHWRQLKYIYLLQNSAPVPSEIPSHIPPQPSPPRLPCEHAMLNRTSIMPNFYIHFQVEYIIKPLQLIKKFLLKAKLI